MSWQNWYLKEESSLDTQNWKMYTSTQFSSEVNRQFLVLGFLFSVERGFPYYWYNINVTVWLILFCNNYIINSN